MDIVDTYIDDYKSKGVRKASDSRVPTFTLFHLNKLKRMESIRKLEQIKRQALVKSMYAKPQEEGGGL